MNHYVYYSYENWGRGYIGYRSCDCLPEEDVLYFGSYHDKTFNPTEKIILETFSTKEEAIETEVILHDFYQVDVNPHFANKARQKSTKFYYSCKGIVRSEEYKKKMSEKLMGREIKPEWIEKAKQNRRSFIGEGNPFYGKHHTEETRELLRQRTTEIWKKQPHPWIGKKHSEETKEKFRQNNKGERNPNYGKSPSPEARKKLSESKIGRKLWNNGKEQKFSRECPGEGWTLGAIKNKGELIYGTNDSRTN